MASRSLLQGRVIEQLLDQVHVGQQHAAAAVALQAQRVQGVPAGERAGCGLSVSAVLGGWGPQEAAVASLLNSALTSGREVSLQGATSPISQAN